MNANEQILSIRPGRDNAVCIATHDGMIRIERLMGDTRRFKITCPPGIKAVIGQERLKDNDAFVFEKGKLIPAYDMVVPLVHEDGSLIGAARPTMFQLIEEGTPIKLEVIPDAELSEIKKSLEGAGI